MSLQTWRGVPCHFNVETAFDAAIAQALALGGFTLVAIIIVLTVAVFRHGAGLQPPLGLAIRAGFVALVGAQVAGGVMIATGMRLVFGGLRRGVTDEEYVTVIRILQRMAANLESGVGFQRPSDSDHRPRSRR